MSILNDDEYLLNTPVPTAMVYRGIECDVKGKYEEALHWYRSASAVYERYLEWERNSEACSFINAKLISLSDRIEAMEDRCLEQQAKSGENSTSSKHNNNKPITRWISGAPTERFNFEAIHIPEDLKSPLDNMVYLPMKFPKLFANKVRTWQGMLFYGPAGCGKTSVAKTLAYESKSKVIELDFTPHCFTQWISQTTNTIANIFKEARSSGHCTFILFENLDLLHDEREFHQSTCGPSMEDIETDILTEMKSIQKVHSRILVLATARQPWRVSPSLLRRFDKHIYFGPPSIRDRVRVLKHLTQEKFHETQLEKLARECDNFSVRHMKNVLRDAYRSPMWRAQGATEFLRLSDGSITPKCEVEDPRSNTAANQLLPIDSLLQVPSTQCRLGEASYEDIMRSISKQKADTNKANLKPYIEWKHRDVVK